jgi:hypothetical protein
MLRWIQTAAVLALFVTLPACDAMERVRGATARGEAAAAGSLSMNLELPGLVRGGEETAARINVQNRTDTAVTHLRAELFLPAWMQPLPPDYEGAAVTMVSSGEGTRLSYDVATPPLAPGESRTVVQRVRIPEEDWAGADVSPSRTVRAWLVGPAGQPLGVEVSSEIAVEGLRPAAGADTSALRSALGVGEGSVGPLRLGMTADEVRRRFPDARDTTWSAEGMEERGMVVPLTDAGGGVRVVARLPDGRVDRITVRDRQPRTADGLGVGSRLEELRAAYGEPCLGTGEGATVVWFGRLPGVSFVLDAPPAATRDPARLPASAPVRELFVRPGADGC